MKKWKEMSDNAAAWLPKLHKYRAALIVLLAGVLLLASGRHAAKPTAAAPQSEPVEQGAFLLKQFEQDLCSRLSEIEGVGRVSLMLSLEQTGESVYAVNVRESSSGAEQESYESSLSVLSDGNYGEMPVEVKSLLPTFRGAVVLCDGADNESVRYAVTKAVSTICGVGADKVTVLKMKQAA